MSYPSPMALSPAAAAQWQSSERTAAYITESRARAARPVRPRVCDTCIRKKVKCNQGRPTCSRCLERGETCTYSSQRRRPGPQPGRSRPRVPSRSQVISADRQQAYDEPDNASATASRTQSISRTGELVSHGVPNHENPENIHDAVNRAGQCIGPNEEEHLLTTFFDIAQDASPIFSKEKFLDDCRNSLRDRRLISAITTITVKLTRSMSTEDSAATDARIDSLLSSCTAQADSLTSLPSLDQFRTSCVLAFYEFHQFPGHQSLKRIGDLTRMAYRTGLDRLEKLRALHSEWRMLGEEDMEEWRAVWWCIYRLDSYSNLASGTPYMVDEALMDTALLLRGPNQLLSLSDSPPKLRLSAHSGNLWKLLPAVTSHPETMVSNIHIITVTMTRHAGLIARACLLKPPEEVIEQIASVGRHLSTLRLALPPGWLNPRRNAFSQESHVSHHARLITVLHLLMTRLMLSILSCTRQEDEEWMMNWQEVLETCQDIASIAEQWDSYFSVKVDPAISFILFTALIFLDIHKKSTAMSLSTLHSQIDHDKTVLRLQLEHFATFWTLPRLLNLSLATFSEFMPGPLTYSQIRFILSRFEAPLHPRWLQFLSNPQVRMEG